MVSLAVAAALLPAAVRAQNTLSALQTDVDKIVERARPSVLTVVAQHTEEHRQPHHSPPERRVHSRVGSGVAVGENEILTTASVVLAAERVVVSTVNGLEADATLVGVDPVSNLALLRVSDLRLPPLRFAEGPAPGSGDWVITLGTSYHSQATQSVGNVAFRERDPRLVMLQLTNVVYPGNSGGAALNTRGELVGIVEGDLGPPDHGAASSLDRRPGGASFVLATESVRPVLESLRRQGRVPHGYLGVSTRVVEVESDTEAGLRVPIGALVESVVPGGPAERCGLRRGDLIVAFDDERVEYPEQLALWVAATPPGVTVRLVWARNEIQKSGRVVLGESAGAEPAWAVEGAPLSAPVSGSRIFEIERQIQRLNRELELLKSQGSGVPR
ncbi:MAG: serine protease [Candidatus Eisenbacteria bacterium]|nr:serine protease [Candidatus Eisenbacteria bacterium]